MSSLSLSNIATLVNGSLIGEPSFLIDGACAADQPRANHISFSRSLAFAELNELATTSKLGCLIVSDKVAENLLRPDANFIRVADPLAAIVKVIAKIYPPAPRPKGISDQAFIHPEAKIGKNVSIAAFCTVEACASIAEDVVLFPGVHIYSAAQIGVGSILHSGVVVREGCIIGSGVTIHNGSVIGADGFGYFPTEDSAGKTRIIKVPQIGTVRVGNNVEIGANVCIDRGALGDTVIADGTKIDNLVQIGHNVQVGAQTIICGQVGIAGSTSIGSGVTLGGGAGVRDHISIADGVRIAARSGVTQNLTKKGDYAGFPAVPIGIWRRQMAAMMRMVKKVK